MVNIQFGIDNADDVDDHDDDYGDDQTYCPSSSDDDSSGSDVSSLSFDETHPTKTLVSNSQEISILEATECSNISFDIDSIIISSNKVKPLLNSLRGYASVDINSSVDRLHASTSSRLAVTFDESNPMMTHGNKMKKRLPLSSFPNIKLCSVTVNACVLYLHMFWIDPPYIPKVPYFEEKYSLIITAAMNLARLTFTVDGCSLFNEIIPDDLLSEYRKMFTHVLPFELNADGRVCKNRCLEHDKAVLFFSAFEKGIKLLSDGILDRGIVELCQLLPHDHDNKCFGGGNREVKFAFVKNLANDIASSITYTLSCAGKKHAIRAKPRIPSHNRTCRDDWARYFDGYAANATKVLSWYMRTKIFSKHPISNDVHIYYDVGLEVNHTDNSKSFVPCLVGCKQFIKSIMEQHNQVAEKPLDDLFEGMMFGMKSAEVSTFQDDIIDEDNALWVTTHHADSIDYLSWGKNFSTQSYSTFFLNNHGNWHTGNTKTLRTKDASGSVYLKHKPDGGICGCQAYCPQSRVIQMKETRNAKRYMDGLSSLVLDLLHFDSGRPKQFDNMVKKVKSFLSDLSVREKQFVEEQSHVRIECLMKADLRKIHREEMVEFPDGFLNCKIGMFPTGDLHDHFKSLLNVSLECLISLMPVVHEDGLRYRNFLNMSPALKTACMYHAEILACEFGTLNIHGTVMRNLKSTFEKNNAHVVYCNSRFARPLTESDKFYQKLGHGLCPSLLPLYGNLKNRIRRGSLVNLSNLRLPVCITSSCIARVDPLSLCTADHVTFEQHRHVMKSLLFQTLHGKTIGM